jgi:SAM-dependent methyltransferase
VERQGPARECGDEDVSAGRGPGQLPWYEFALRFVKGKSVLDAGCGLGKGMDILRREAREVLGQDLDPRLIRPDVTIGDLSVIPSKSVDVVVSIDVIEHVADPDGFLVELARIAREGIFVTTPNWTASRCKWPYHLREYTPREFKEVLSRVGTTVELFKGTPSGDSVCPVRFIRLYFWLNDLRVSPLTAFPCKCWNHLLPWSCRIHSHHGGWVRLP